MFRVSSRAAAVAAFTAFLPFSSASAHCFVGGRFLPATLNVDDPCVADELSLPTVSSFKTGDDPSARQLDISAEYSKRITETFGISIGPTWSRISAPGMPKVSGFQNLETTFKWQLLTLPQQELVMSVGLSIEWGGSGAQSVGADSFTTYTPTIYIGKGFGDLPSSLNWLRPFAVTGQFGYAIPGRSATTTFGVDDSGAPTTDVEFNPRVFTWGGSIQYSMPYLKSSVIDLSLPEFFNHLIPIVEAQLSTPVANILTSGTVTTGTINPGVIWVGNYYQVGVQAIVPVNRASGTAVGAMAQLHLYLDDIFPRSIGKPIFGAATAPRLPFGR
ncbi:MAG TPA: hypothetical protein VMH84_07640 [Xanthobacteraceae bacterium]|nr:hypothetical protein [Xanthobacteraceae bacterium]